MMFISISGFSQTIFMQVKGQKQGQITDGNNAKPGMPDWMAVKNFSFEVISPRDAASGLPTGKRMHHPIVVVKRSGKSSTNFFSAITQNENLTQVIIKAFRNNAGDKEELFETIELTNASISSYQQTGDNSPGKDTEKGFVDTLEFTYQKIKITVAGHSAEDNW